MKNKFFLLVLLIFLIVLGYREFQRSQSFSVQSQSPLVLEVKQKMTSFIAPARVEVRNYIKDEKHKYQNDVSQIKKIKIKLNPKSNFYLELNLFVNESDAEAPLIAQFLLFDAASHNLIQEENLSLSH